MKSIIIFSLIIILSVLVFADDPPELRAVYAATYDINTQAKCQAIIDNVLARNINAVFVEVRGRADAYYYPNREDLTYPNNEPRGQLYSISPSDLDVLQYFIDRCHNATRRVEVHAWCTTYNTWYSSTPPSSPNHIYNAHPEWVTENEAGTTYTYADDAPLDPGIPAVQDHLYNVFMDIVRNYDIDGIHFDYIRLLASDSGYDPVAKGRFLADTGWNYDTQNPSGELDEVYKAWRRDQIAKLVQRIYNQTMLEKPWVEVSAFTVNFTDSIENLGQGYNWWVAHDAIDVLHPSCYASAVPDVVDDWNFAVGKLAQNGDQNKRPLVAAIGDYLLTDPNENAQAVTTLRANSRPPDGFNFFDYGSLFVDGTPPDEHANNLFNTGGPMDDWAPVPSIPHKTNEETTPPNPPASLSAILVSGVPRVTFNKPAPAGDGDLPVHYRLYRHTSSPVQLYYSNMVMEWWDLTSSRTSFSFDDAIAGAGIYYYAAVSYDDWNNQAVATAGPVTVTTGGTIIIESHTPSGTITPPAQGYSQSGSWYGPGSTAKSTASGLTGVGTEWSSSAVIDASYTITPNIPLAGYYNIYITTPSAASVNAANSRYAINHPGGPTTGTIALTAANTGDKWTLLASNINFNAGTGGSVTISEQSPQSDRFYADAVKFIYIIPPLKEPKPPVTQPTSSVTEVIVDSEPTSLDYDDKGSWSTTNYSPSGTLYNGTARYFPSGSFPLDDYAVWLVDLPRAGTWAIDGWIRREQTSLAQGAQYRFVDGTGTVRSTVATQQPQNGTEGWLVNIDGVLDSSAYSFNKERVYITLYGNTYGSQMVIADAIRFRLIQPAAESWTLY